MSRCFPFPPPGYENKARTDNVDLLAKEKQKEKKHKKEKDKERREGKEKKDKDRSKDKHKEKKDRKEKHKDKRRDKDRDKDKHRTSDDRRIEGRTDGHNEEKLGASRFKADEVKYSKFTEELDRRIRDEEKGAAHRMFENSTGSIQRSTEGLGTAIAIEKERTNGNKTVGVLVTKEQRSNDGTARPAEKIKDKEAGDRKGDRHRDRDREEKKSKGKDNHRRKEKEKEKKTTEKNGLRHEENDTHKELGKKDHEDSVNFKPLAPHKYDDKLIGTDGNIKKRKDVEMNGFLHENDVQPNKFQRPAPSFDTHVENGRTLEALTPHSSIGHQAKNNLKSGGVQDNKEHKINGSAGVQPSSGDSRPLVAVDTCHIGDASLRTPHPDSKYLSRIYTVPTMEEWPESDDQEWLLSGDKSRPKPKAEFDAEETPQVWAEVLQIESADAFALPYVIPY